MSTPTVRPMFQFKREGDEIVLRIKGDDAFLKSLVAQSMRIGPENSNEGIYHFIVCNREVKHASFTYK